MAVLEVMGVSALGAILVIAVLMAGTVAVAGALLWIHLEVRHRNDYFSPHYIAKPRVLLDFIFDWLYAVGLVGEPSVQQLVADGIARAGELGWTQGDVPDLATGSFRENLQEMLNCTFKRKGVASLQRFAVGKMAVRDVAVRVMLHSAIAESKVFLSTPLPRIVFVVGPPRIGSTFVHEVMGEDSVGVRTPRRWELEWPFPSKRCSGEETITKRIAEVQRAVDVTRWMYPELEKMHLTEAHQPDECFNAWVECEYGEFAFTCFEWDAYLKPVSDRFMHRDMTEMFVNYRKLLCYLIHSEGGLRGRTLLLKSPLNSYHMESILHVFPEAKFLCIHRDPCAVVGSFAKLMCFCHGTMYRKGVVEFEPSMEQFGIAATNLIKLSLERSEAARRAHPDRTWVDISFSDLVSNTLRTLKEEVYEPLGIQWSEEGKHRMESYLVERRKNKKGKNVYDLADYGLSRDKVRASFSQYMETYSL